MSERFTVVFAGRVQDIPGNPYKVESLFGVPVAIDHADVLADNERIRAENERLRAGGCARDQGTTQYCAESAKLAAENERLRAALERLVKRCEDDFNGGRKLRRADVVKTRAALDGQPAPGKEE